MNDEYKVIILFIAHEGVTQPSLWNYWKEKSENNSRIVFKVHAPSVPKYGKTFCEENSIGFYDTNSGWCEPSLILVYLQIIKAIILEYDNSVIYLVSGYDIPITSSNLLFSKIENSVWGKQELYPSQSKLCYIGETLHQWLALNSKDAIAIHKIMIDDGFYKELVKRWLDNIHKSLKKGIGCPDESFIALCIKENKEKFLEYGGSEKLLETTNNSFCTTFDIRSISGAPSPVTWTSLYEKQLVSNFLPSVIKGKCLKTSLYFMILQVRISSYSVDGNFFFRKVASTAKLDDIKFLYDLNNREIFFQKYKKEIYNNLNLLLERNIIEEAKKCDDVIFLRKRLLDTKELIKQKYKDFSTYFKTNNPNIIKNTKVITNTKVDNYINELLKNNISSTKIPTDINDIKTEEDLTKENYLFVKNIDKSLRYNDINTYQYDSKDFLNKNPKEILQLLLILRKEFWDKGWVLGDLDTKNITVYKKDNKVFFRIINYLEVKNKITQDVVSFLKFVWTDIRKFIKNYLHLELVKNTESGQCFWKYNEYFLLKMDNMLEDKLCKIFDTNSQNEFPDKDNLTEIINIIGDFPLKVEDYIENFRVDFLKNQS